MKSLSDRSCREELIARIAKIRPDTPRLWGKMTAPQMICHLNDAFLGIIGEKPVEVLRGFSMWPMLKYVALYSPAPWPKGVPTRPEMDQLGGGGTPPVEFECDVRRLFELMERFWRQPRDFEFRPHPMFKMLSEAQWMRWGYLHVDHHLRQFGQ
jgi:hypothetical protein